MHKIMSDLHQDHINLARVLTILEQQVKRLTNGDSTDFFLMLDATNYIRHYPDLIHHPRENKVYEVLKKRTSEGAEIVEQLMNEHKTLPSASKKFHKLLDGAANDSVFVNRDELVNEIQQFIEIERKHMNLEEDILFPIINKALTEKDWDKLDSMMEENKDPLFSGKIEESYQNLYRSLDS
jgi:hemerythrin-like domain-containing protein